VEDVAAGHCLAAERGCTGERYILGERNMTLKEILDVMAGVTGRPAPRVRMPYAVALAAGYTESLLCSVFGREPRIPLEGVRMAKHRMFVDSSRAVRELGFRPAGVESAIGRAVRWYINNGYVAKSQLRSLEVA